MLVEVTHASRLARRGPSVDDFPRARVLVVQSVPLAADDGGLSSRGQGVHGR